MQLTVRIVIFTDRQWSLRVIYGRNEPYEPNLSTKDRYSRGNAFCFREDEKAVFSKGIRQLWFSERQQLLPAKPVSDSGISFPNRFVTWKA